MRKILLFIISVIAFSNANAEEFSYDGLRYATISDTECIVTGYQEEPVGNLEIPRSVQYGGKSYSVTEIGNSVFFGCDALTSVEIPNSVTEIGFGAFMSCSSLTSVKIPNSVTTIGEWAFRSCYSLTSVEIPNSVKTIGREAFSWCYSLTSIEIPNSVTEI